MKEIVAGIFMTLAGLVMVFLSATKLFGLAEFVGETTKIEFIVILVIGVPASVIAGIAVYHAVKGSTFYE